MDLFSLPSTAYKLVTNIILKQKIKNVILDPLTTIVRLCILAHLPHKTKIGIYGHQIIYFGPDSYQGTWRTLYGDKRSDLHNLYQPIKKSTQWYDPDANSKIKYLFTMAHQGLVLLKDNYHTTNINSDNSTYISLTMFDNILTGKQDIMYESVTPERAEIIKKELTTGPDNVIHSQLRNLWTDDDIDIVFGLLKKIDESDDDKSKDGHIRVIKKFLEEKDNQVEGIVNKYTISL